jgi:hypothetical protein
MLDKDQEAPKRDKAVTRQKATHGVSDLVTPYLGHAVTSVFPVSRRLVLDVCLLLSNGLKWGGCRRAAFLPETRRLALRRFDRFGTA